MKVIKAIIGTIFGLILFYIWIFILIKLELIFFSEKTIIFGAEITKVKISSQYQQIASWLTIGLLPFFLIAGHYILYSNVAGGIEKTRDVIAMKSVLIGFFIWLLVTVVITLFKIDLNYRINMAGGFLTMLIVYFLIKK
ncbi:MAG: hypothetical protein OIN86_02580 [Candidatus Methanoperedens sp.]|nr:hypothetical protein [Candidatus Methanoperedens sp.]CAG1002938.1 hypothetical protein METP1_03037 [Methanosarcinales archaeon]